MVDGNRVATGLLNDQINRGLGSISRDVEQTVSDDERSRVHERISRSAFLTLQFCHRAVSG